MSMNKGEIITRISQELFQSKEWQGIVDCSKNSVKYTPVVNDPGRKQLHEKIKEAKSRVLV